MRLPPLLAVLLVLLAPAAAAAAPARTVPQGFLGVMADGPLLAPAHSAEAEFARMVRSGVESVRVAVYWNQIQPYADAASVPPGSRGQFRLIDGVPTDFSSSDRFFLAAARRGLRVLPVVDLCPAWARKNPERLYSPPLHTRAFARFVGVLVHRYGPGGSFWAEHPELAPQPAHDWQIWNEPAGGVSPNAPSAGWGDDEPFQNRYIAMLRFSREQIKAGDPHGRVILAGLFGRSWMSLYAMYLARARGLFDEVALNIFTQQVPDVLEVVRRVRAVMKSAGDSRLPVIISELTWPSSAGRTAPAYRQDYEVSQATQALRVSQSLRAVAAARRKFGIERVFWYAWLTDDAGNDDPFYYAGLRRTAGDGSVAKPAQAAYTKTARALEGCAKRSNAARCGR
ncbi:MAG: hypothetical protein NVSMB51_17160 [Solirubrobacteraceae bacterium]